jgi:AbrB family looped-hinge helix DNA binding protein
MKFDARGHIYNILVSVYTIFRIVLLRRLIMTIAKMSGKGLVVIPKEIRERHGLKKGDKVHFIDFGGVVAIVPFSEDPVVEGFGMLKGGPSMTEGLLLDRHWELEREEKDLPPPELQS